MSEKFTASNGLVIVYSGEDSIRVENPQDPYGPLEGRGAVTSLREFFLHERDQELGRWRWPEDPGYAILRAYEDRRYVIVLCEQDGTTYGVDEDLALAGETPERLAAAAYFAAHPLPKPAWHDAKPGEVWVITDDDGEQAAMVTDDLRFETHGLGFCDLMCPDITAARRLWPEAVES